MADSDSSDRDFKSLVQKIEDYIKDKLLDKIVTESKQFITATLTTQINQELYNYGTHYNIGGGLAFDYSLTTSPKVTDD